MQTKTLFLSILLYFPDLCAGAIHVLIDFMLGYNINMPNKTQNKNMQHKMTVPQNSEVHTSAGYQDLQLSCCLPLLLLRFPLPIS